MITDFWPYLLVMAGVTYLTRMLPLMLVRKKIKNRFLRSFFYCLPYSVLTAMTLPGILYATGSMLSAAAGLLVASFLAYRGKSVMTVAMSACLMVFLVQMIF